MTHTKTRPEHLFTPKHPSISITHIFEDDVDVCFRGFLGGTKCMCP